MAAASRPTMSVGPPAGNGTISVMGRSGKAAWAAGNAAASASAAQVLRNMGSLLWMESLCLRRDRAAQNLPGRGVSGMGGCTCTPLTNTRSTPAEGSVGASQVARSATVSASNTTMSAQAPTAMRPRPARPNTRAGRALILATAASSVSNSASRT